MTTTLPPGGAPAPADAGRFPDDARRVSRPIIPAIAIVRGGPVDRVRAQLDNLAGLNPTVGKIWLLQEPRDPAIEALADAFARCREPPRLSVVSSDRPMGAWWPFMLAWFVRAPYTLLAAPEARLAPHFVGLAARALRARRHVVSPEGIAGGSPVLPGPDERAADVGTGAWLFDAQWVRFAWSSPPQDLDSDPMPVFAAALRSAGIGTIVPPSRDGRGHLLLPAPAP